MPVEIIAQAKPKEAPNDALPKFFGIYSSKNCVGMISKETHIGKLVTEWNKLVSEASSKPEIVDMSPAVSAFMAQKDQDELVCHR